MEDIKSNDALLTAINNLFEHPDAIQILLRNEALNAAISNYINAAAEKLKPESKWREVWTQDSAPRDHTFANSSTVGIVKHPVIARLTVLYSEQGRVAHLYALIRLASEWDYEPSIIVTQDDREWRILLNEAAIVNDFGAAIEWGQSHWVEAVRLFEERTTPLEGGNHV